MRPASQLDELTASFANWVVNRASSESEKFKQKSCNQGTSGSPELVVPTFYQGGSREVQKALLKVTVGIAKNWECNANKEGCPQFYLIQDLQSWWRSSFKQRYSPGEILARRGKKRALKFGRRKFQQGVTHMSRGPFREIFVDCRSGNPAAPRTPGRAWTHSCICDISAMLHALPKTGPKASMVNPNASAQRVQRHQCQIGHALPHEGDKTRSADIRDQDDG